MTIAEIYRFASQHKLGVVATTAPSGQPEAAVVGIAVTEELEVVFDTLNTSRKYQNIVQNPRVALVIGWDEITVQLEGEAIELTGKDADRYREVYYSIYPDGRDRAKNWPELVHILIKPRWVRYSHFSEPPKIEELNLITTTN